MNEKRETLIVLPSQYLLKQVDGERHEDGGHFDVDRANSPRQPTAGTLSGGSGACFSRNSTPFCHGVPASYRFLLPFLTLQNRESWHQPSRFAGCRTALVVTVLPLRLDL